MGNNNTIFDINRGIMVMLTLLAETVNPPVLLILKRVELRTL